MKRKTRTCFNRIVSLLLMLILVFNLFAFVGPSAVSAVPELQTASSDALTLEDLIAGHATAEDIYGVLDQSTVPDIIGYEEAKINNHVQRLYEDEGDSLNTVIFLNADATQTMYVFDFPVKYVDKNGTIRDVSLEIADKRTGGSKYQSEASPALTTFSAQFSDGVSLNGNGVDIRLVPVLSSANTRTTSASSKLSSEAQRIDEKTVSYRYNDVTTVEYSLTYTGFKEDIVVSEYTGQTEYPFYLYTNGLKLEEINGSYFLVDDKGDIKATIGDIIIFTADERNNAFGKIVPTTVVEDEEYLLTIVVDADYLADPNTAYPIRIDPTIEINYNDSGASAIEDITISTNTTFSGSSGSLYIGRRSTEGIARSLMRFPGIDYSELEGATIVSASVKVRDLMCESTQLAVSCHVFTGNTWNANSATWANTNPNSYEIVPLSTNTFSWSIGNALNPVHWYSFDITKAVQGWIDGNYSKNKGIIFKVSSTIENGSTINNRTFGSYNRESNKPTLSVTYSKTNSSLIGNGTYYLNNKETGKYLQKYNETTLYGESGKVSITSNKFKWIIQPVSGGYVIKDPGSTKYLGVASETATTPTLITVSDSALPEECIWSISAGNGGCLVKNTYINKYLYMTGSTLYLSSTMGTIGSTTYNQRIWRIANVANYGNAQSYSDRELTQSAAFSTLIIDVGDTGVPTITPEHSNTIWSAYTDFSYARVVTSHVTVSNGVFTGVSSGVTTIIATHKVTGLQFVFAVVVGDQPTLTVSNYVDQGYRVRYGGYENVQIANSYVASKFERFFGIALTSNYNMYTSAADNCKIQQYGEVASEYLTPCCTHQPTHLTTTAQRDVLGNGTATNSKVLWTGHIMNGNAPPVAYPTQHSVVMTPSKVVYENENYTNYPNTVVREMSNETFLHELSHQLGAPDHYCYNNYTSKEQVGTKPCSNPDCDVCHVKLDTVRSCIMSGDANFDSPNEAIWYCSDCLVTINNHLTGHHQ